METYVYFLCDPRTKKYIFSDGTNNMSLDHTPFYVGKGTGNRYKSKKNSDVQKIIEELKLNNLEPKYVILPCVDENCSFEIENWLTKIIGLKQNNDGPLLNKKYGGKGGKLNQIPWNKNIKSQQVPWNKGRTNIHTKEQLENNREKHLNISPWNKGKKYKGRPCDELTKKIISEVKCQVYELYMPNGKIIIVNNLKKFCLENDLNYPNLCAVSRGLRKHSKNIKIRKI